MSPPAGSNKRIPQPKPGEVVVRMYRQGLGDCFLLTFRGDGGSPAHVLIDCGTWDPDPGTLKRMADTVKDIRDATDNHLDLLVVTHEHWDHNSGFLQQQGAFDTMTIDRVWLAWTEDPQDRLAKRLKSEYQARRKKLAAALAAMRGVNAPLAERVAALADMAAGGGKADPAGAMKWAAGRAGVEFLKPGQVELVPGAAAAARAFVLGPPHDKDDLEEHRPTKKQEREDVVYHFAGARRDLYGLRRANALAEEAFFSAVAHHGKTPKKLKDLVGEEREEFERALPFDAAHQLRPAVATARRGFARAYAEPANGWRRIDEDWLNTAANIGLWMDGGTNNTSLVLAFELLRSRKVLLFVGDAQVGNWLSWPEVKFPAPHQDVTAADLVERTVLYKVGHHGSHNATLRKDGVERMKSPELVAMIPVDRASLAKPTKKTWRMPRDSLLLGLRDACGGRVIRADDGVLTRFVLRDGTVAGIVDQNSSTWQQFKARTKETPMYVEYTVS